MVLMVGQFARFLLIVNELLDNRTIAADGTAVVSVEGNLVEIHCQGVEY